MPNGDLSTLSCGQLLRRFRKQTGPREDELKQRSQKPATRRLTGLIQTELEARSGVGERGIRKIESGESVPDPATIRLLADALDLSPEQRAHFMAAADRERRERAEWRAREAARRTAVPATARATAGPPLPALVGRARELELLDRHIGGTGPPLLVWAGEPGIGKSRLLHEAAGRGEACGWRVLRGGCQRRDGEMPYAPLLEALKGHIGDLSPARLRAALAGCAWLAPLLPELAGGPLDPLPAHYLPPEQERRLVFEAVARFLANAAGPAGTLLVLDDLQWAGQDALDLLLALLRSPSPAPAERKLGGEGILRVVGAYRDNEAPPGHPLAVALADLAQARLVTHHTLAPLSLAEAGSLFDEVLEGTQEVEEELRERLVRRAEGVPFFIMSLAQALHRGDPGAHGDAAIPWDLAQDVRRRVAALPEAARTTLAAAAVVGRRAAAALLAATTAQAEDAVLAALDAAAQARLLDEEAGGAYRFAHDIVREIVEADLGAARRLALHRRVAEALERGPGEPPIEELAYHYGRSDADEKAVLYLERAGDRAEAQAAHVAAADYYGALAERLDRLGRARDAAQAREKQGLALRLAARYEAALDALDRAAEAYRTVDDLDGVGRAIGWIGQIHADLGTLDEGLARVQALLMALEEGGPRQGLASLYTHLSFLLFVSGRYTWQLAAAMRGADLAREIGDDAILASAEGTRGLALMMLGDLDDSLAVLLEAIAPAEHSGENDALSSTLTNVATAYMWRGEFAPARVYAERSIEAVERVGHPAHVVVVTLRRAFLDLFVGDWPRARETIAWAVGLESQMPDSWTITYPALTLGVLLLLEGAWDEATAHLERSSAIAGRNGDIEAVRWAQMWLAERDLHEGRPEVARDRLLPLLDRPEMGEGVRELDVSALLPRLAWAYLELGEVGNAVARARESVERARAQQHRIALADALWVWGLAAARQGQWDEARQALEEGLAVTREMPYPYDEARTLDAYGRMHLLRDETDGARERFAAALDIFKKLGAGKDAARVECAIAGL